MSFFLAFSDFQNSDSRNKNGDVLAASKSMKLLIENYFGGIRAVVVVRRLRDNDSVQNYCQNSAIPVYKVSDAHNKLNVVSVKTSNLLACCFQLGP